MGGRVGLWAYQKSLRAALLPERKMFYFLRRSNLLLRNFWCGRNNFTEGDIRLTSESGKEQKVDLGGDTQKKPPKSDAENVYKFFDLSPSLDKCEEWKKKFVQTMLVYPNFVSPGEEDALMKEIEPYISRLHYENSHWDDAIHEYRETERSRWNKKNQVIINRIRALGFPPEVPQLKLVHILDLAKKGIIKPHIDSVRFCGNTIAGLSILSDSIMRLRHDVQKEFFCDVYLPRFSLYVMKDFVRYEFTHEILGESESVFKTNPVNRDRRISIICRNEPENSPTPGPIFKAMAME